MYYSWEQLRDIAQPGSLRFATYIHGTGLPEDMTIPLFFYGEEFKVGEIERELSLLDVAPTIAALNRISIIRTSPKRLF